MQSFRVTAVSLRSQPASPQANLDHHAAWVARAKADDPDIICFPELGLSGYSITPGNLGSLRTGAGAFHAGARRPGARAQRHARRRHCRERP